MKLPEENTQEYRRAYYEGYLAGVRDACGLGPKDPIPEEHANMAIRLHTNAIANRDDVSMIESPPSNTLPGRPPVPTETINRPDLPGYMPHWAEDR